jgi:hypothetical protein
MVPGVDGAKNAAINKYGLGRNVAALAGWPGYIFEKLGPSLELRSWRIQRVVSTELRAPPATVGRGWPAAYLQKIQHFTGCRILSRRAAY